MRNDRGNLMKEWPEKRWLKPNDPTWERRPKGDAGLWPRRWPHPKVIPVLIMMFFILACSAKDFRVNSYKTLSAGAAIYESGYPAFLELHKKGLITDTEKAIGKEIAIKYWAVYHAAAKALNAYEAVRTAENKDKVIVTLNEASSILADLTTYIQPFLSKGVK